MRRITPAAIIIALALCCGICPAADGPGKAEDTKTTSLAVHTAPLLLVNNRLFTYAEINDVDRRLFFIDNGWSDTTLEADLAEYEPVDSDKPRTVSMMHKKSVVEYYGRIETLEFGELSLQEPVVRFSEQMDILSRGVGRRVFGVLGYRTLRNYLTAFDFRRKKVYFYQHTPQAVEALQEAAGSVTLPFGGHTFSSTSEQLFTVRLVANGVEVDAVVDFGYSGGLLTTIPAKELGVSQTRLSRNFTVAVCGFTGKGSRSNGVKVNVGSHRRSGVHTIFFDCPSAPRFTLVGIDFLQHFRVTFDYKNQSLYLVPNS